MREQRSRILRHRQADASFIGLAMVHGILLLVAPSFWLIALGLWWNANTIAHNFIHRSFFRRRAANRVFSAYLSLVLGIPQTLWRNRHLAHHAGVRWRLRWSRGLILEAGLVAALWGVLAVGESGFFLTVYLPGWLAGLVLCQLQGHFEHVRGPVSHYGRIYNLLFFNDGYHVEHHARPGEHWTLLPARRQESGMSSRWPAVLRWLEYFSLESLERIVLRMPGLQHFVLRVHERAFRRVLAGLPEVRRIAIIGGGLFPRTAMVLRRLLPEARIAIIDASAENLAEARRFLTGDIDLRHAHYTPGESDDLLAEADLIVVPLAFAGDRAAFYRRPPASHVLVHDWLWRRRAGGVVISLLLLKCVNLVSRSWR